MNTSTCTAKLPEARRVRYTVPLDHAEMCEPSWGYWETHRRYDLAVAAGAKMRAERSEP